MKKDILGGDRAQIMTPFCQTELKSAISYLIQSAGYNLFA